jgi:hypothetical protein
MEPQFLVAGTGAEIFGEVQAAPLRGWPRVFSFVFTHHRIRKGHPNSLALQEVLLP